jgi:hypothetical protein
MAILAVVVLVAIKPAQRLADARDARRGQDIGEILTGIHECVIDKKDGSTMPICLGPYTAGDTYEIVTGAITSGCKTTCPSATNDSHCLQLNTTLADYFVDMPKDPSGVATGHTGYSINVSTNGIVQLEACKAENIVVRVSR